jgi:integrase
LGKKAQELGALQVSRLKTPGLHFVGGVDGLALQVAASGSRSWVLRTMIGGKRREMGLGGFPGVSLARAREDAGEARRMAKKGIDPIEEGRAARSALAASRAKDVTFKEGALSYLEAHEKTWSSKSYDQWLSSLQAHAFPKLGNLLMRDIDLPQVLDVLEPIWHGKTETAGRLRGRLERILDWATVRKYRFGENPARWKGHLEVLLPAPKKIQVVEHFKALHYTKVGAFMADLRQLEGQGAKALEFAILTASRSTQARGAAWAEIDIKEAMWTVPKERMKDKQRDHRVPLSKAVLQLLEKMPRIKDTDLVFPAAGGGMISDATMSAVLKRMKVAAVPHGFRSTFKDWASEVSNYTGEVSEMALAHAVGDKVEEAYRRGDLFAKRRRMMEDWAKFCATPYKEGADVVQLAQAHRA